MKNILLLSDFSSNSKNAIHYAMRFFENENCTFHLMHVHKIRSFVSDDLMHAPKESVYESITKVPRDKLNSIAQVLKDTYKNEKHQFEIHIDFDVFTDAIKQAVINNHIDFIVVLYCICPLLTVPKFENRNQNIFINIVDDSGAIINRHPPEAV